MTETPLGAPRSSKVEDASEHDEGGVTGDASTLSDAAVTPGMATFLRAVYRVRRDELPVSTQMIAAELGVSGPAVTIMAKRLHAAELVRHERYRGVTLTPTGERVAGRATRRHRLIELYLVEALGYGWDEVHVEAERLATEVSDELAARLEAALGFPTIDPHGDPIPDRDGGVAPTAEHGLLTVEPGQSATISRISDRDPRQLKHLGELGFGPGVEVTVVGVLPFDGPINLLLDGSPRMVGPTLAAAVFVRSTTPSRDERESTRR